MVSLPSHADEPGSCRKLQQVHTGKAAEAKPHRWWDRVHEEDGGADDFGPRPQNGQELLKNEVRGMMVREGETQAWGSCVWLGIPSPFGYPRIRGMRR